MTLEELHNHAKRTGQELALTIGALEQLAAIGPGALDAALRGDVRAMLQHALTRHMECSMWVEQAVRTITANASPLVTS